MYLARFPGVSLRACSRRLAVLELSFRHKTDKSMAYGVYRSIRCYSEVTDSFNPQPQPDPFPVGQMPPQKESKKDKTSSNDQVRRTLSKMFESAMATLASLTVLGIAGYGYHNYYKHLVLGKMENAFNPGDPVLELSSLSEDETGVYHWIQREEQTKIDGIINGTELGHYYLIVGEKGTGKTSMILNAIHGVAGDGIAMFEVHSDPEIVRIRLGKALDFEFHEDYIGSLFSIRGPRDTTALLDIERAFNKLEKVALKHRKKMHRPLVLVINSLHLLRDDDNGRDLLELIQQHAEKWAATNLITIVLNSDDYWVYERLKQYATRMEVFPVLDLPKSKALAALRRYRQQYHNDNPSNEILEQVYFHVGGRLTFLSKVARSEDMLEECWKIRRTEKVWLLSKFWILGAEMDDDVMDEQKYSSAAMVLAKALVDMEKDTTAYDAESGHILPEIPLYKAREIMTRADFIKDYDHNNIFTIDSNAMVRADSVPMQHAFREICSEDGFEEHLQATLDRIADIESLGRTRELVAKDLVHGAKYHIDVQTAKGKLDKRVTVKMPSA